MAVHLKYEKKKFTLLEEKENTLEKRWTDVDKTNFLALLADFYHDTGFHKFFSEHAGLYSRGLQSYEENVMKGFGRQWYSEFYGKEPGERFSVVIGFCNGGGSYGSARYPKGGKKKYLPSPAIMSTTPEYRNTAHISANIDTRIQPLLYQLPVRRRFQCSKQAGS